MKITLEIPDSASAGVITIIHSVRFEGMILTTKQLLTSELHDGAVISIGTAGAKEVKDEAD